MYEDDEDFSHGVRIMRGIMVVAGIAIGTAIALLVWGMVYFLNKVA